jgi:predicted amidohydrolase
LAHAASRAWRCLFDREEVHAIRDAAKQTGTVVSIGISEKVRYTTAILFNSNIIIRSDEEILVLHRKLMLTFFES